jgi:hypothetical protein
MLPYAIKNIVATIANNFVILGITCAMNIKAFNAYTLPKVHQLGGIARHTCNKTNNNPRQINQLLLKYPLFLGRFAYLLKKMLTKSSPIST